MRIKKIHIAGFGKHVDYDMQFDEGFNIYTFDNEWGKSTILEFIRAMFYGLRKATKLNNISDYDRYRPWNSKEFGGTIEYEVKDKETFKVYRNFETKEVKVWDKDNIEITDRFPLSKEGGVNFAVAHLGLTADMFDKVIYIKQNQAEINLEKDRIAESAINIIQTGSREVSVDKVISNLKKQLLEKVGNNRTVGRPINLLNLRVKDLETEKFDIEGKISVFNERLEEINEYNEIKSDMENEIEKLQIADSIKDLEKEYEDIEKQRIYLKEEERRTKSMRVFWILGAVGCVLATIVTRLWVLALPALLSLMEGILDSKKIKLQQENVEEREKSVADIKDKIKFLKMEFKLKFEIEFDKTQIINRSMKEMMDEYAQVKVDLFEAEKIKKEIDSLKERELEIVEEICYCNEEINKLKEKEEALNLAIDTIRESMDELSRDFYPIIEKEFNEIEKEIITDGRSFKLTKEGEKLELTNGNMLTTDVLSFGTKEQLFLSLRIAIANFYSAGRMLPLLFDDIFAYWDSERIDRGIELFKKMAKKRQIIIFTSK